jgi:hypothetical protein
MEEITINNFNKKDKKKWTVNQMKIFCKKNKLSTSGKKDELYERINIFLNSELIKIEKGLKNLTIGITEKYTEFNPIIYTKLETICFDYIKNRFYILINYDGNINIDSKIGFFKKDTKDIKKDIKEGFLYKDCIIMLLGYWVNKKNKKVYNIDY